MHEYKIIVVEDHDDSMDIMIRFLENIPEIKVVNKATDGEDFIEKVKSGSPDIVLIDINLPKLNGITATKECLKYQPHLKIIFVTAYEQYAIDAFDVSAIDYVTKPISFSRLVKALDKAKKAVNETRQLNKKLYINHGKYLYFISENDILFLEKVKHQVLVHTYQKVYAVNDTLESLSTSLSGNFFKSHRSFIINLQKISYIKRSGNTFLAYFNNYKEPAYVSKMRINALKDILS